MAKLFLSTLPKSGTHILVQFFGAVGLKRYTVQDDKYRLLNNMQSLYEMNDDFIGRIRNEFEIFKELNIFNKKDFMEQLSLLRGKAITNILDMPDGFFACNHYTYDSELVGAVHNADIPVVFLYRDPRDYVVSLCNHIIRHPEHKHHQRFRNMGSYDERYSALIKGSLSQSGLYDITPLTATFKTMIEWIHDPRVLTMRFEEIIGPKGLGSRYVQYRSFERLVNHINLPISREKLYDCIDLSYNEKHTLFVKGQIGQWDTVFSEEVLSKFHAHTGNLLKEWGYDRANYSSKLNYEICGQNDINRLRRCLEHAEKDFLAERKETARLKEHVKKLTEMINHIEADSKERLELIFKHEARIRELEAALKKSYKGKTMKQRITHLLKHLFSAKHAHLSIVIGSYNRKALLEKTIESIRSNNIKVPYEIIVVDGGSNDGTMEWLIAQKDIITIVQHNRGEFRGKPIKRRSWGYFMNLGFKTAQGKYILMLSDDCLLLPEAVNNGLDRFLKLEAEGRKIGGVAFYFRNWPSEEKYYIQNTLGGKLFINHGIFLRKAMEEVGWADEDRYIFYKADGDLCLKIWEAGYEIADCPDAIVEHYYDPNEEVRQSNNGIMNHDRKAYLKRWEGIYYHPGKPDLRGPKYIKFEDVNKTAKKIWGAK